MCPPTSVPSALESTACSSVVCAAALCMLSVCTLQEAWSGSRLPCAVPGVGLAAARPGAAGSGSCRPHPAVAVSLFGLAGRAEAAVNRKDTHVSNKNTAARGSRSDALLIELFDAAIFGELLRRARQRCTGGEGKGWALLVELPAGNTPRAAVVLQDVPRVQSWGVSSILPADDPYGWVWGVPAPLLVFDERGFRGLADFTLSAVHMDGEQLLRQGFPLPLGTAVCPLLNLSTPSPFCMGSNPARLWGPAPGQETGCKTNHSCNMRESTWSVWSRKPRRAGRLSPGCCQRGRGWLLWVATKPTRVRARHWGTAELLAVSFAMGQGVLQGWRWLSITWVVLQDVIARPGLCLRSLRDARGLSPWLPALPCSPAPPVHLAIWAFLVRLAVWKRFCFGRVNPGSPQDLPPAQHDSLLSSQPPPGSPGER